MNIAAQGLAFINGKEVEWADQSIYLDGVRIGGIKGNRHGVKSDKAHLFAEGDYPFGIQSGNSEPSGTLKVLKSVADTLNVAAVAAGGRTMNDLQFDIVTVYTGKGVRGRFVMTQLGCQITNFEYGWDQGAKEMVVDLPYLYMDLIFA